MSEIKTAEAIFEPKLFTDQHESIEKEYEGFHEAVYEAMEEYANQFALSLESIEEAAIIANKIISALQNKSKISNVDEAAEKYQEVILLFGEKAEEIYKYWDNEGDENRLNFHYAIFDKLIYPFINLEWYASQLKGDTKQKVEEDKRPTPLIPGEDLKYFQNKKGKV